MWAFCTSHYSGSRSVTRSYSEPSSRCGRSRCIPGTLNDSFFSWMKNPSESLLENSVPSALDTFAALFIKSLKLYQFFTWKGYFSNFHLLNICCTLHRISWVILHLLVGLEFLADQEVLVPLEDPTTQKKYQGIRFAFLHYRSSLSGLKRIQTHLCFSLFKVYHQLSIQYDIFSR